MVCVWTLRILSYTETGHRRFLHTNTPHTSTHTHTHTNTHTHILSDTGHIDGLCLDSKDTLLHRDWTQTICAYKHPTLTHPLTHTPTQTHTHTHILSDTG